MRIIDCHVHLYPKELLSDPAGWGLEHGERHWGLVTSPRADGTCLQGWADADRLLRDMDAAGIEKALLLGWYWENPATCRWQNDWHVRCVREHPDRLAACATLQPALEGEAALETVRRAAEGGLAGLGELSPHSQGYSMRDESWLKVVDLAGDLGLPIHLHVTAPVGRDYPGRIATPLEDFQWLAEAFPRTTFVLAHWGGLLPFFELDRRVRRAFRNVYYDTAASPLLYEPRVFRAAVDAVGAEKILFGSDYPLLLHPRVEREPGFTRFLADIGQAGLSEAEREAVLGGNARRLFGWK